jgi:hypothetical protein
MKKQIIKSLSSLIVLMSISLLFAQCESGAATASGLIAETTPDLEERGILGNGPAANCSILQNNYPQEALSDKENEYLLFMREEEKMARDVYQALYGKWNVPVFKNIAQAEQRHMDAVGALIAKYELTDPVGDLGSGLFQNSALQSLYVELTARGMENLESAYAVGAKIEDLDLNDLMGALADPEVDNADIKAVFNALAKGSRNHLRAFTGQLERLGSPYQPEFISTDLYLEITQSSWEAGGCICGAGPVNQAGSRPRWRNRKAECPACTPACDPPATGRGRRNRGN